MIPRLVFGELTGQVYVATRYSIRKLKDREGEILVASHKYDVTQDFARLAGDAKTRKRILTAAALQ